MKRIGHEIDREADKVADWVNEPSGRASINTTEREKERSENARTNKNEANLAVCDKEKSKETLWNRKHETGALNCVKQVLIESPM